MQLLFVCTGNTCRSPLAEAIARQELIRRAIDDVDVASAGVHAWPGAPASDGAMLVALEHGIDLSEHRARILDRELLEACDPVLVMSPHHLERVEVLGATGRAFLLTEYASRGASARAIADPFGGDLTAYREAYADLRAAVHDAMERLVAERTAGS